MKFLTTILFVFILTGMAMGQQNADVPFSDTTYNLGFERIQQGGALHFKKAATTGYEISVDSTIKHSGKYSMRFHFSGDSTSFTAYMMNLPHLYKGHMIALSGYIKTDRIEPGRAGLVLRLDPRLGINNMYNHVVKGTTNWQKNEISLPLDAEKTKSIVIGGILEGKGTMWLDDLEVKIDGKPLSEAQIIPASNYPAEADTEFSKGAGITHMTTNPKTVKNLQVLGEVWGYLKFFHPRATAGDFNFGHELFRLLPSVANASSDAERDELLSSFLTKLGTVSQNDAGTPFARKDSIMFDTDTTWWHQGGLSEKLLAQFRRLLLSNRPHSFSYYYNFTSAGNVLFTNDAEYPSIENPDIGVRLLALYRYWNAIAYFYPYRNLIKDWPTVLATYIPIMIQANTRLKYELALAGLVAKIKDTHAGVSGLINSTLEYYGKLQPPFAVEYIQNKWVVTKYLNKVAGRLSGVEIGDILEKIGGKPVAAVVKSRLAITSGSNAAAKYRNIGWSLLKTNEPSLRLGFFSEDTFATKNVQTYPADSLLSIGFTDDTKPAFGYARPGIGYIYGGTFQRKDIQPVIAGIKNAKGLIVDLRNYPNGSGLFMMISSLSRSAVKYTRYSHIDPVRPGRAIMGPAQSLGAFNHNYYGGKIVVLVNKNTQSAAEFYAMSLRAIGATVVGSTTAGADGNVSELYLPGSILTTFSGLGIYYPDGSQTQQVGIVPDIFCEPTAEGIKAGKDEQLERAIEFINTGK
ncbi:S41 family peptidase [Arachidicoccus ginsenosidivorans]|uniref:Tail specific protease domain-containing protein n=1 Tax=Arachidicoccus ginsenosidivorans TaxID=496057 RepID=A0A5B8VHI0_9BACT|nr:S41 family peptidase [Arachidicoccus ginsenosidivorans]QEC70729.1 hypothetical protein FSB73_02515 [Arachidicoccus ginsenosidivorans]